MWLKYGECAYTTTVCFPLANLQTGMQMSIVIHTRAGDQRQEIVQTEH